LADVVEMRTKRSASNVIRDKRDTEKKKKKLTNSGFLPRAGFTN
jgi:hypothetical protein